ncbi:decaprenylphospho-beta-D-erythro-pentofuranosid-2-ulose 2-reductase [Nocardioides aequoreus]|uniref:decaprenylphospho-beta-D-erythro-pentofuranosid- 2-ulose 2-reductase n=1 Tax=Nocardioides aequoreus TaxID=397278 RepID=UPI0004C2BF07|nr:decaprenylphospho-beta-D-erythro-pentofuranosid-2-ulose 2-reductase [Nocardioides aequoreus]
MRDSLGRPQTVLLLGGTSDIGLAMARAWAKQVDGLRVTLAARPSPRRTSAAADLERHGCRVRELDFDALEQQDHERVVRAAAEGEDVDVAVVAFGVLGEPERAWQDPHHAAELAATNYTAAVLAGVALGRLVRDQGHGMVVALSSVAGERPRRSNFVYGSSKAGFDAYYTGLGEALRPFGGRVLVVRPGFVRSSMTEGLAEAPLAVDPDTVAAATLRAVASGREQLWVPRQLRPVMSVLRHLPRPVFRRLPL